MATPSAIVELVRRVLDQGITDRAAIEQVAQQYYEAANELHTRLARAIEFARAGLRMEVRTIATARPPLLESAELFVASKTESKDRHGREDARKNHAYLWREYCRENGLPVPPRISRRDLEELQISLVAFESRGLEQLHRLYRKQNIGLDSSYSRLQTLRLIAEGDATSSVWSADINEFEPAAIGELRNEFATAISENSLEEAAQIIEKLRSPNWVTRAASHLAERSQREYITALARRAHAAALELQREMYANYMAQSPEAVALNLAQWDDLVEQMRAGGVEPPAGAKVTVEPVREWYESYLSQQEVASEARARLQGLERAAVDAHASADEIQERLASAEAMPGGVPGDLRDLAQRRVHEHTASIKLRRNVRIAGAAVVALGVLGAAVWAVRASINASARAEFASAMDAAVDRGSDEEVQRLLASATGAGNGFEKDSAVLKALARHKEKQLAIVALDDEFDSLLAAAGDPSTAGADSSKIEAAAKIARTDDQRKQIARWREGEKANQIRAQNATDAAFLQSVSELAKEIDSLEALAGDGPQAESQAGRIENLAAQIGSATGVGKEARVAFEVQRRRLTSIRDSMSSDNAQALARAAHADALTTVVESVSDAGKFAGALQTFIEQNPESKYSAGFGEVLAQSGQWRSVMEWMPFSKRAARDPLPTQEQDRAPLRKMLEEYRNAYPKSPYSKQVALYNDLLTDTKPCAEWLANIIKTWPPMLVNMIELDTGERFYYLAENVPVPASDAGYDIYKVVTSWLTEKQAPMRIERKRIRKSGPSPQALLAERLKPLVRGSTAKHSGEGVLEVVQMIRDDAATDPAARAYLLKGFLPQAEVALPNLQAEIQRAIGLLSEEDLETIDWMAGGKPSARSDFKAMTALVSSAVPVQQWSLQEKQSVAAVRNWLQSSLRMAGVLDKTAGPARVAWTRSSGKATGEGLFAVATVGADQAQLVKVGEVGPSGEAEMNALIGELPTGTPIFIGSSQTPTTGSGADKQGG